MANDQSSKTMQTVDLACDLATMPEEIRNEIETLRPCLAGRTGITYGAPALNWTDEQKELVRSRLVKK